MQKLAFKSIVFGLILFALSCSEETNVAPSEKDIDVQNGYLVFKDQSTFDLAKKRLESMSGQQRVDWEAQFPGFTSINTIFNRAIEEEERHHLSVGNSSSHSAYYQANAEAIYHDDVDVVTPNLSLDYMSASPLINGKGLVKIGQLVFELKRETKKILASGNEAMLPRLKEITESNSELGVQVVKIQIDRVPINGRTKFTGPDHCDGYTDGGGQRVRGYIYNTYESGEDFFDNFGCLNNGYYWYHRYVAAVAINQIHQFFSWNNKNTGQLRIEGSMHIEWTGGVVIGDWPNVAVSNPNQVSSITASFWDSGMVCEPIPSVSISGTLDFYGRDGSNCEK